jgi:hypothetical protein
MPYQIKAKLMSMRGLYVADGTHNLVYETYVSYTNKIVK